MHESFDTDDHNRIVLHPVDECEDHQREFVNACFIDVREKPYSIYTIAIVYNISYAGLF